MFSISGLTITLVFKCFALFFWILVYCVGELGLVKYEIGIKKRLLRYVDVSHVNFNLQFLDQKVKN